MLQVPGMCTIICKFLFVLFVTFLIYSLCKNVTIEVLTFPGELVMLHTFNSDNEKQHTTIYPKRLLPTDSNYMYINWQAILNG